jgi:hypothetical protein
LCSTKKYEIIKKTIKKITPILYGTGSLFFQYFFGLSNIFTFLNNLLNPSMKTKDKSNEDKKAKIIIINF